MRVQCDVCLEIYDDIYHQTYCPHAYFEMNTLAVKNNSSKVCHTIEELNEFLYGKENQAKT